MIDEASTAGITPVPNGQLATIVTYLEMTERIALTSHRPAGVELQEITTPDPHRYRALFRAVGRDWLWVSRLLLSDTELGRVIGATHTSIHVLHLDGQEAGLLELDSSAANTVEIAYFGLVPQAIGQGLGKWLMGQALEIAWQTPVERVWLHTCTLDHPSALPFYKGCGFAPYARGVEILDDPRHRGIYDRHAALHIPMLPI